MNEHADQLREAFESHEHLAPDAAAVYGRVQELSRSYRRRRIGVQAAGGAVLATGLVAGGLAWPGGSGTRVIVQGPASGSSSATTPPSDAELQADYDAYFAAGYGYDDALKLAKIWKLHTDVASVKAEAGRRLLAGQTLPIKPGPETDHPNAPGAKEAREVDAFFAAGYDYEDAVKLAKLWKTEDPYHAKILGGKKLLAGKKLPIEP